MLALSGGGERGAPGGIRLLWVNDKAQLVIMNEGVSEPAIAATV